MDLFDFPLQKLDPARLYAVGLHHAGGIGHGHRVVAVDHPLPLAIDHLDLGNAVLPLGRSAGSPQVMRLGKMSVNIDNLDSSKRVPSSARLSLLLCDGHVVLQNQCSRKARLVLKSPPCGRSRRATTIPPLLSTRRRPSAV